MAVSILPISSTTLVVNSDNAGIRVLNNSNELQEKLKQVMNASEYGVEVSNREVISMSRLPRS